MKPQCCFAWWRHLAAAAPPEGRTMGTVHFSLALLAQLCSFLVTSGTPISSICLEYAWYIPCICRSQWYTWHIHGKSLDMPCISIRLDIHGKSLDTPCISTKYIHGNNRSLHGDSYTGIKYAGVMLKQHSIDSSTASIDFRIFVERKVVTALCVGGLTCFIFFCVLEAVQVSYFFFCEEPRSKGQNEVWTYVRYSSDCRWWYYIWCGLFAVLRF